MTTKTNDRLGYVTLGDGPLEWPARFDPTQRWNGWLCPRFRLKDVLTIAAVVNRDPAVDFTATVQPDGVTVQTRMWDHGWSDDDEPRVQDITPAADGWYPLGGYEWCWSEIEVYVCGYCGTQRPGHQMTMSQDSPDHFSAVCADGCADADEYEVDCGDCGPLASEVPSKSDADAIAAFHSSHYPDHMVNVTDANGEIA